MPQISTRKCKFCQKVIPKDKRKDAVFCSFDCKDKNKRIKHKDQTNAYQRGYYAKKKQDPNWYDEHKEKRKVSYYKNRDKEIESAKKWSKDNYARILKHRQENYYPVLKERRLLLKMEVFSVYSKRISNSDIPCCACCGENSHIDFLALDHIEGRKSMNHKRNVDTGHRLRTWAKKNNYPDGLQVLCHNCNTAKGENGICPHQNLQDVSIKDL